MLYLSITFLLHVVGLVAVVTSSNSKSCLIQTCLASQGGDIVAAIYDTSDPYAGGDDDAAEVTSFLTLNCGLSPQITHCYVDCAGIYGEVGAYWTVQNCNDPCASIIAFCEGYVTWFCSTAVSNVCQLAAPSGPTSNRGWLSDAPAIFFPLIISLKQLPVQLGKRLATIASGCLVDLLSFSCSLFP